MIGFETILRSADNTDIRYSKCIGLLGNSKKKKGFLGEVIRTSIFKRWHVKSLIKSKLYLSVIIAVVKKIKRKNGLFISFSENRVLTLTEQLKFLGTNVKGPVCKELRTTKKKRQLFKKIISYAGALI